MTWMLPLSVLMLTACDTHAVTGVVWKDIHGWRPLGDRWALALGQTGEKIAIYDLSSPDLLEELELGLLGTRQLKVKDVLSELRSALKEASPDDLINLEGGALSLKAYIRELSERDPESLYDELPTGWSESVPWRQEFAQRPKIQGDSPESFTLADIDLESVATDPEKMRKLIAEIEEAREAEGEDPILGPGFLASFKFERVPGGGYRMRWVPPPRQGDRVSKPKKMVDFTLRHSGVIEKAAWQGIKAAINGLAGLIPIPVVNALLKTALGRFFHAHDLTASIHLDFLAEMARLSDDGAASPLSALSAAELLDAERSLAFSEASLAAVPLWIWRKPEDAWRKKGEDEGKNAAKAAKWLGENQWETRQLSSRFSFGIHELSGQTAIFAMPLKAHWIGPKPVMALEYGAALRVRDHRVFIEVLSAAVSFGTHLVPVVGGLVNFAYSKIVEAPVDRAKRWEGRLKINLLEGELGSGDWSPQLRWLDLQKVNRLELGIEDARALVEKRKKELGLSSD